MTATEVLRRMLDERGVEYFKHEDGEPLRKLEKADEPATSWHMGGASVCAVPIEGSDLFDLWIDHCTTEQAIAATLGATDAKPTQAESSGTCHMVLREDIRGYAYQDTYECSECGEYVVRETYMGESEQPFWHMMADEEPSDENGKYLLIGMRGAMYLANGFHVWERSQRKSFYIPNNRSVHMDFDKVEAWVVVPKMEEDA